jgi:NTE family protein
MRRHVFRFAHDRAESRRRLMKTRVGKLADLLSGAVSRATQVDPVKFCAQFLAAQVPAHFSALEIPLTVVTSDLHRRTELAFTSGPLTPALAGSIAIPGLFQPVALDGHILVDGGATNPLPFDHLRGVADITVAVDVFGVPPTDRSDIPGAWETLFSALSVMGSTIISEKLSHAAPDLLIRPNVAIFRTIDFYQASAILRAAEPVKVEVKAKLGALLAA